MRWYKMKTLHDIPESGQFVLVWEYNNKIWSGVFIKDGNTTQRYENTDDSDEFKDDDTFSDWTKSSDIKITHIIVFSNNEE